MAPASIPALCKRCRVQAGLLISSLVLGSLSAAPIRIMPLGDSITAGFTDNTSNSTTGAGGWSVPFEFGYRRQLYHLLTNAGYDFLFVGQSAEPFNYLETGYGDPTKGGTVSPTFDLRTTVPNQNGHRGYGGIRPYQLNAALDSGNYIAIDNPDLILLMVGINQITDVAINGNPPSTVQLDTLVTNIFSKKPTVKLIVAEITPYAQSSTQASKNPTIVNYNTYIRDTLIPKFQGLGRSISRINQHKNFLTDPNNPSSATITSLYSNSINHPTNAAYDTMAATWFDGILAIIPPTLPVLDQTKFSSSAPVIGHFVQPAATATETFSFSLVAGAEDTDNAKFSISGNTLQKAAYNFNSDPNGRIYHIRVRATGNTSGFTGERSFALTMILDSDGDLLPDEWELSKTTSLSNLTLSGDFDLDGLSDTTEYNLSLGAYPNIDPTQIDTDGDGLNDGDEIAGAGQRPPTNPTLNDTDGDNVSDLAEDNTGIFVSLLKTGTNPTLADTDSDGQPDGSEIIEGSNPHSALSPGAPTVAGVSNSSEFAYAADVSTTDLLNGLTGASAVHTGWNLVNSATPEELNDGIHGGVYVNNNVEGAWSLPGSVSTFILPQTTNGNGWDINNITSIASWQSAGFGNQKYTVSIRRAGETTFSSLASVDFQPFSVTAGGASKVSVQRPGVRLAGNVTAIQFTMLTTAGNAGRTVYREIDVFGTQSAIPPTKILDIAPPATGKPQSSITWSSYPLVTYRVESSENLDYWIPLATDHPSGGITTTFRKSASLVEQPREFFRISANQ